MTTKYDDIINLPHHTSARHLPMSMHERAAQFSSFKALTGLEDELAETARVVERKLDLSEEQKEELDRALRKILSKKDPVITVTYFEKDPAKDGGMYVTFAGTIRTYDTYEKALVFTDGKRIHVEDVLAVSGSESRFRET